MEVVKSCLGFFSTRQLLRSRGVCAFIYLRRNIDSLGVIAAGLQRHADDIEEKIKEMCSESHIKYKGGTQVKRWLAQLERFHEKFCILFERRRNVIMIVSTYKLGKKVVRLMEEANNLDSEFRKISAELLIIIDADLTYTHYKERLVDSSFNHECAELGVLEEKIKAKIKLLLSCGPPYMRQSCIVSYWLEKVDEFSKKVTKSRGAFEEEMDDKSYYKLGAYIEEVDQLLEKVRELSDEGKKLLLIEESLTIVDFGSKYSYYRRVKVDGFLRDKHKKLKYMKADVEKRVLQPYMKWNDVVSSWLQNVDVFSKNVNNVTDSFKKIGGSKSESMCNMDMLEVVQEVDQLLENVRKLSKQGIVLLSAKDESLAIVDVDSKYSVYKRRIANGILLGDEYEKLKRTKVYVEERVRQLLLFSEWYMKRSDVVSSWLQKVDVFSENVTNVRDSFEKMGGNKSKFERNRDMQEVDQLMEKARKLSKEGINLLTAEDESLAIVDVNPNYSYYGRKKLDSLLQEKGQLISIKEEVEQKLGTMVDFSRILLESPSYRTSFWLKSVDDFAEKVNSIRDSFEKTDNKSDLESKIDVEIDQLFEKARELSEEGGYLLLAGKSILRTIQPLRPKKTLFYSGDVGHGEEFSKALHLIDEGGAKVIAISGMGGIGKTTLLKRINIYYSQRFGDGGFNTVAYVHVGKQKNVQMIQTELCKKFYIDQNSERMRERLLNYFNDKTFLLLMDDIWDELKLEEIGIPISNFDITKPASATKKNKVVITTRSEKVCKEMGITKTMRIEMGWLDDHESWRLFVSSLKNDDDPSSAFLSLLFSLEKDDDLPPQARDVANYCSGLPLALVTIARAMMGKVSPMEWNDAKMELEQAASASKGMGEVFSALKFSFDRLENDGLREILLYCSLYPQGHNIVVEDLVDLLIGEGVIPSTRWGCDRALSRSMIYDLVDVRLLMCETEGCVKLHDCVRDMAVWLTDGTNYRSELFLRCSPFADPKRLHPAKRVSMLYGNDEEETDGGDINPELQTLLWETRNIDRIPADVFTSMRNVRVLNLSNSSIKEIDASIGCLLHLQYLNLQSTLIDRLPEEVGNLTQLRQLILSYTSSLKRIPRKSICRLHNLEKLDMFGSVYIWRWDEDDSLAESSRAEIYCRDDTEGKIKIAESYGIGAMTLHDLNELAKKRKLSDVSIQCHWEVLNLCEHPLFLSIIRMELHSSGETDVYPFQNELFPILSKRIQTLAVRDFRSLILQENRFPSLRDLSLSNVEHVHIHHLSYLFEVLSNVGLQNCPGICDLEWLRSARYLKVLKVENCERLEYLLPSLYSDFSYLKELRLIDCGSLESISRKYSLHLRSLESLYVRDCANLKELPFRDEGAAFPFIKEGAAPKLASIRGSNDWWESLRWESKSLKDKFSCRFSPF